MTSSATGGAGGTPDTSVSTGGTTLAAAGSGAGGAPSAGGASGAPAHDPTLFDWPEGNPDAGPGTSCQAGHYVGTYACNVKYADAGVYQLTGPVDLRLDESQNGEFLSVSGGTLKSTAGILALDATLVGKLNCQTGEFSGTLQNGTLSIPPFPPGGTFAGNLSAQFSSDGPRLVGSWTLIGEGVFAGYSCTSPWTAVWQAS
jgi:hypothetical protein